MYSTCTIHSAENEGMVKYILEQHPEMKLVSLDIPLGCPGLSGQGLTDEECAKVRRFDPTAGADDTMGFFIAKFFKEARMQ